MNSRGTFVRGGATLHVCKIGLLLLSVISFAESQQPAPVQGYTVVARYPHSTSSYTEGFFYRNGMFYEGTGLEGRSALLVIQPRTGKPIKSVKLPPEYFGEGIVDWGPYLYEWTWKSHVCFVYDRESLRLVKRLTYEGQGWGMTRTNKQLITSNGSANLTFRDPKTFRPVRSIEVHDGQFIIDQLNELEFIRGEIYANIWHSERIARISPLDGHVIGWIDLTGLLTMQDRVDGESVLNGIAYDAQQDRIFVTGKQWPSVFQIKVISGKSAGSLHH
jgi:glutamine cyclotransferase